MVVHVMISDMMNDDDDDDDDDDGDGDDEDYRYGSDDDSYNISCIWRHMVLYLIPYEISVQIEYRQKYGTNCCI